MEVVLNMIHKFNIGGFFRLSYGKAVRDQKSKDFC